jgi:hypothetical protein
MTLEQYLESQRGKTYTQIIAEQPMETVQGSLLKQHYQEIKTILAAGLQLHLDTFVADTQDKQAALTALRVTFEPEYLADPDFKVNFNVAEVMDQYLFCIAVGALPQQFADRLIDQAKYARPIHNITRQTCADYFGTDWQVLPATDARNLIVRLTAAPLEPTYIQVEMRDVYAEGDYSDWYTCQTISGVFARREYKAALRHEGYPRQLRWRCEYPITVTVMVA